MNTNKQMCGKLGMGLAALLLLASAATAQFDGSAVASTVSGPAQSTDVVAGTAACMGTDGQLIGVDWINMGFALAGVQGPPSLKGSGKIAPFERSKIVLLDAAPESLALLFVSLSSNPKPFKGGTLVPAEPAFHLAIVTDSSGGIELSISGSANLPAGFDLVMQYAVLDEAAPQGVALSNAVQTSTH
jgi:hypothetical protein